MAIDKKQFTRGIVIRPDATALGTNEGEIKVDSADSKIKARLNSTNKEIVTNDQSQTLTNKTIDADANTITNIDNADIKAAAAIELSKLAALTASKALESNGSGEITASAVTSTELGYVSGVTSAIQTQINGKMSSTLPDSNIFIGNGSNVATAQAVTGDVVISNAGVTSISTGVIVDADINAAAGIDATKLADGTVTNAELQYINSLTSNAQTQLNAKLDDFSSVNDNRLVRTDGTGGNAVQESAVTLDDAGAMSGLTQLVVDSIVTDGNQISTTSGALDLTATTQINLNKKTKIANELLFDAYTDATSGSDVTLATPTQVVGRLTSGTLVSVAMIPSPSVYQEIILTNATGADVTVKNDTGATAANRIYTGTGANITLANQASICLVYDNTSSRWKVVGGSGSSSTSGLSSWATSTPYTTTSIIYFTDLEIYKCNTNHTSGTFLTDKASGYWSRLSEIDRTNLNLNPEGEFDASGYSTYADAAGTIPIDMTGGSPNITWTRNTTLPLGGVSDFLFTKDAVNRQGEGVAYTATMPKSLFAKNIQVSFDYTVASGTYADGDLIIYCYDVTNATLLEPVNISIASVATALPNKHIATFQTSLTGTSYRIGFHVASTSASAYTLQFRNIYIGEQVSSYGAIITDWKSFTPTGSWDTNTTYAGYYRRVGDTLEVQTKISLAGAPNAAALTINLPSGLTIDTAKLASNSGTSTDSFGKIYYFDSGVNSYIGELAYSSTTSVGARYLDDSGTNIAVPADISSTAPHTWGASDFLVARYSAPIVGWSSNVALSSDAGDGRLVTAIGNLGTSQSGVGPNNSSIKLNLNKAVNDTTASFNTSTYRYVVPVQGTYSINGKATVNSTNIIANSAYYLIVYKNGAEHSRGQAVFAPASTALQLEIKLLSTCISGDYFELYLYGAGNNSVSTLQVYGDEGGSNYTSLQISKVSSGSQRLAASETVAARYEHIAGQSIPNAANTVVDFDSKSFDTHNAVTTGSGWKFTAPVSGIYQVSGYITYNENTFTAGNKLGLVLFKNGTLISLLDHSYKAQVTGSYRPSCGGIDTIRLIAGDTIALEARQDEGGARSLETSRGDLNYVNIVRIGN